MDRPSAPLQQLTTQLASVVARRERLARHVEHRDEPLPRDSEEQALELENDEAMTALVERLMAEEAELRAALERVEQGTYGRCTGCGEPIDTRRLAALPATAVCIRCAN